MPVLGLTLIKTKTHINPYLAYSYSVTDSLDVFWIFMSLHKFSPGGRTLGTVTVYFYSAESILGCHHLFSPLTSISACKSSSSVLSRPFM